MRLFVAVSLPPTIVQLLESLPRPESQHLRWTTPAQWHITLRFLGEVDEVEAVAAVADAVAGVTDRCDDAGLEARLGPATAWFPGRRVLQVPVAGLDGLAMVVRELTAGWGPDREPGFAGHVTLARMRGDTVGPASLAGMPVEGRFRLTTVTLFASSPGPGGAAYDALATVPVVVHGRHGSQSRGGTG